MKVMLLFPPHWTPTMPHLALPSLAAFLREKGVEVLQRDLNIEAYNALLSRQHLYSILHQMHREVRNTSRKGNLSDREKARLRALESWLEKGSPIVQDIEAAKSAIRGPGFYQPPRNIASMATLIQGLALASVPYHPARLTWRSYDHVHPPSSAEGILQAIADPEHDMFADFYQQSVLPSVASYAPDVVGISISAVHQAIPGLTLARLIKETEPSIHITLGGKMLTCWRDALPRSERLFSLFDSAIIYEGEHALLELVARLDEGRPLDGVPNLIYREGSRIRVNAERHIEDIEGLPLPSFDDLPLDLYLAPERILPFAASRGCYWRRCAFCSLGYGQSLHYQERAGDSLAEDLAALRDKYNCHHFFFVDEALSPKVLEGLSRGISERGLKVSWTACARFERALTAELCHALAQAGCKMLMFGLESGSQRLLSLMDKGTTLGEIHRVLRDSAQAGIWNHLFAFFGFPTETEGEAEETMAFFMDNLEHIHSAAAGTFILEKCAKVAQEPQGFGIRRILKEGGGDLAFQYAFETERGMNRQEAAAMARRFSQEIAARRKPRVYFHDVYNFLYASHFPRPQETFIEEGGASSAR